MTGIALGLKKLNKLGQNSTDTLRKHGEDEMIFKLEEEHIVDLHENASNSKHV